MRMLRIFIADDEASAREELREALDWQAHGCCLVGEAADGQRALEALEQLKPDLLLTDIRMPGLSGLDLAQRIQERGLNTAVILITSFEDFSYLQAALHYGAVGYLVKHDYSAGDVLALLQKTRRSLEQTLLADQGRILGEESRLREIVLGLRQAGEDDRARGEYILLSAQPLPFSHTPAALKEDGQPDLQLLTTFESRDSLWLLLHINGFSLRSPRAVGEAVKKQLNRKECFVAVSRPFHHLKESPRALEELTACQGFHIYFGGNAVIPYEEIRPYLHQELPGEWDRLCRELPELAAQPGMQDNLEKALDQMFCTLRAFPHSDWHLLRAYNEAASALRQAALEHSLDCQPVEYGYAFASLDDMAAALRRSIARLSQALAEKGRYSPAILQAVQYLRMQYAQPVSLRDIAEHAGISRIYLSQLFKKETGRNVSAYLLEIRIQKARDLLEHTDQKVYEVAQAAGFPNPQHFSSLFKRQTGVSPLEYRVRGKAPLLNRKGNGV